MMPGSMLCFCSMPFPERPGPLPPDKHPLYSWSAGCILQAVLHRGLGCLHTYLTASQGEFQVMLWPGCPKDSNGPLWRQEASCPGSRPGPCFFCLSSLATASQVVLLGPWTNEREWSHPDLQEPSSQLLLCIFLSQGS